MVFQEVYRPSELGVLVCCLELSCFCEVVCSHLLAMFGIAGAEQICE